VYAFYDYSSLILNRVRAKRNTG